MSIINSLNFHKFVLTFLYWLSRAYYFIFRSPTLGVRVLIVHDHKVLLLRHTYRPKYYMPGGGIKSDENLVESAEREVFEETGLLVRDLRLLGVYRDFHEHKANTTVVYVTENIVNPSDLKADEREIQEVAWFGVDNLPKDASVGTEKRIREYLENMDTSHGIW